MNQVLDPITPDVGIAGDTPWRARFFAIWGGQALSLIGSALTQFVLVWWIAQTTGSAGAVATAGIMALLPQALFSPLAGAVADRHSRRAIMIGADTITALCMVALIALFASGRVALWHVYGLMLIRSSMQAFQSPAAAASTAMLVPASWLSRAAGLNQLILGLMSVAAAPLGALALAWLPMQGALLIDVITATLGIVPLLIYRIPQRHIAPEARVGMWADVRAGIGLVLGHRGLVMLYGLQALLVLTIVPAFVLTPLLVQQHFGGGVNEVALMEGGGGLGMILGGVAVSLIAIRRRIMVVLITYAASCAAVALAALAPSSMLWLAVAWWFVSGVTYSLGNAPLLATLQTVIPNHLQGRALSLFTMIGAGAGPLGLLAVGPLSDALGIRAVFIGGSLLAGLVCLLGLLSRSLLDLETTPADAPALRQTTGA